MPPSVLRKHCIRVPRGIPLSPENTCSQKAFVIYCTHSTLRIYYAKLPNFYLSAISTHGIHYREQCQIRVQLRRTKAYHLRLGNEREDIFRLLARLLWYLSSGRAHVGYLFNYPDNPLHDLVLPSSPRLINMGSGTETGSALCY